MRCCCDPSVLHGYLEVDEEDVFVGSRLNFAVAQMIETTSLCDAAPTVVEGRKVLQLEVALLNFAAPGFDPIDSYLAVKDNGATIEELRQIDGFTEAP